MQPFSQNKHQLHDKLRNKIIKGTKDPKIANKGLDGQSSGSRWRSSSGNKNAADQNLGAAPKTREASLKPQAS